MQISTISFTKFGHKRVVWHFKNNLDEHNLEIEAAFINWSARDPEKITAKSFCEYVLSKNIEGLICKPTRV